MKIFTQQKQPNTSSQDGFPDQKTIMRSSIYQLFMAIVIGLAGIDFLYTIGTFVLSKIYIVQTPLPFDLHHHAFFLMFTMGILKSIIQFILISSLIIRWATQSFVISGHELIHRTGLFNIKETIHDLRNIRSVTIQQSLLGKLFHFGNINVEISASGGFQEFIDLPAMAYPEQFQHLLSTHSTRYTELSRKY
jgi:uncharacterized membrane protein YdbT with pleckstrin-like domain